MTLSFPGCQPYDTPSWGWVSEWEVQGGSQGASGKEGPAMALDLPWSGGLGQVHQCLVAPGWPSSGGKAFTLWGLSGKNFKDMNEPLMSHKQEGVQPFLGLLRARVPGWVGL